MCPKWQMGDLDSDFMTPLVQAFILIILSVCWRVGLGLPSLWHYPSPSHLHSHIAADMRRDSQTETQLPCRALPQQQRTAVLFLTVAAGLRDLTWSFLRKGEMK